jgi:sigma-B regulation protein RsbU (phosphoserine phosphatase)
LSQTPASSSFEGADRLALLARLSQTFNSSLDLHQVLNLVMDEVITATRAERGFLMLREADGSLNFRAARGLDQNTIDAPESQVSRSVIDRVAQEGKPLLTSNAQNENWLSQRQSVMFLGLRSVLCVPLQLKDETLGVIYVDNRFQVGIFNASDLELLTAIAASAAIAIENARLYHLAVEKGRLERELQLAREVQIRLLPDETPQVEGWEFAAEWLPARQVSGDYYDFIYPDRPEIDLVIADVSDKGMPAALYMALTRSVIRASMLHAATLAEGVTTANRLICTDAAYGMFVTLCYACLNPQTGEMVYVNAGHNPPLFYQAAQNHLTPLTRTGMALGIEDDARYEQRTVQLASGDFILFYTDGVTDAINTQEQEFGRERLCNLLNEQCQAPAWQIVNTLLKAIEFYTGDSEPFDDVTIVLVKRL